MSIKPTTVEGIKRLAKQIKRERALTHTAALHEAAKQAGFQNWQHAHKALTKEEKK